MSHIFSERDLVKIKEAEQLEKSMQQHGIWYCRADDVRYPHDLASMNKRPAVLYYRGDIDILNSRRSIAVIGTRKASENGGRLSYLTGAAVAKAGLNVVNGLALGCDTEALKGALSVGGKCAVFLPGGLDDIQPKSNVGLAEKIVQSGGCLLSEYPIGTEIQKFRYVERDRLQSGVSEAVLVIEAEKDGGTMHTVKYARAQYKRLACYTHALVEHASGNQEMEKKNRFLSGF